MDSSDQRIEDITDWLKANKPVLLYSDKVEIRLSIKGRDVQGKITVIPDNRQT